MNLRGIVLFGAFLVFACSEGASDSDCGKSCEPFTKLPGVGECQNGHCTPTIFECFDKSEFDNCRDMCESVGSTCAEKACAGATYIIHGNVENCMDPSKEGVLKYHSCDEPIDWLWNTGAQCCCEQP